MSESTHKQHEELIAKQTERLKELTAINKVSSILKTGKSIDETLLQLCMILPSAWQYPKHTSVRIIYDNKEYVSPNFEKSQWSLRQTFETNEDYIGLIEVHCTKDFTDMDEEPFSKEEKHLIRTAAHLISEHINSVNTPKTTETPHLNLPKPSQKGAADSKIPNRQLLQRFINKKNKNRDVYHDLMPFKVKEILLVANLYDAYGVEKEGRFSEHILGEYSNLNLTSLPRVTGVSTEEEVMDALHTKPFDMIIFMTGSDLNTSITISKRIKETFSYIPIYLLLNNSTKLKHFNYKLKENSCIDNIFIWNGDSRIFFAMVKSAEDKINVENDTAIGGVRVILMVEDSPKYYSKYIPMLYDIVMDQTRRIISDVNTDEQYKVLRLRARPKILLVRDYESAVENIRHFKDNLLCLITDVKFNKNGVYCDNAGFDLVKYVRTTNPNLPIVIQSSDNKNAQKTYDLRASFIFKGTDNLMQDFKSFITHYLGFGNFIYKDREGRQIAQAASMKEFEMRLKTIPDDTLLYHKQRNHFSLWLMARGEIQLAKTLAAQNINDFENVNMLRKYLVQTLKNFRTEQNKGTIVPFETKEILDDSKIVALTDGSLGGKGRGIAFVNTLVNNYDFESQVSGIHIKTPRTLVIGINEFELFMDRNNLHEQLINHEDTDSLKALFLSCKLSNTLEKKIRIVLREITTPIAIRSSGLFEDSSEQPFAGIFDTYLLPNTHADINVRLHHVLDAIKLVFASMFSKIARGYIKAVNHSMEDEKMAVVIQEVVGRQYGNYFYPHISGVAQSLNYYPFPQMSATDGFAVIALGLGKHVVEGEKSFRFNPKHPNFEITDPKEQLKNTQSDFYAINLNNNNLNLLEGESAGLIKLSIDEAEKHGTLKYLASVYNEQNNTFSYDLKNTGARVLNFSHILKYNYTPLAESIEVVLDVMKEAVGGPVEIEFAVDLNKDEDYKCTLYLLQMKPLTGDSADCNIEPDSIEEESILLLSEHGMGNGKIEDIKDVVFVNPETFDTSKTEEIAMEIERLNSKFQKEETSYMLIGPGRWGSRDLSLGIPVTWYQISNAGFIVETSIDDYPLEASLGSHFFHNVSSMGVGYFSIQHKNQNNKLAWDMLKKQRLIEKTNYVHHVQFDTELSIKMDGKKGLSVITLKNNNETD